MQRTPEPDLMDDDTQARAYAEADFSEPHEHFIELFKAQWPERIIKGRVLDLGCGAADISIRFANAYPECEIEGVDGSNEMLAYGIKAVSAAGLSSRIDLSHYYLPDEALQEQRFDAVISNSLLHHLKDPMTLWQTVRACVQSNETVGTPVFIMDLLRPSNEAEVARLVNEYAADEPAILQRDFHRSLCAAYRPDEVEAQLAEAGLNALKVQVVSDRHLIVAGLL